MRIDNLTYLVGGELKSRPAVTSVASIASDPSQVRRGDLFVARNKEQIPAALAQGAYGVLFEGWVQISDPEIAWIQVPSLTEAAQRLIRFQLIRHRPAIYALDPVTWDLATEIIADQQVLFAGKDPFWDLQSIQKQPPQTVIFDAKGYFGQLALESEPIEPKPLRLHTSTLFESSILFEGHYFERAPISPLLLPHLQTILSIASERMLAYSLRHRPKSHLRPIFIDAGLGEVEFGASDRVIIHEPDYDFAKTLPARLKSLAPWARTLFVSDRELEGFGRYEGVEALKEILYNWPFQYLCLAGAEPPLEQIRKRRKEPSLF